MAETVNINIAELEIGKLTEWVNEPTVRDLKQNIDDAEIDNEKHYTKVREWLDNRNIEGAAKPKKRLGRSSVAPKLIRKQAEWRYSSLAEPFLDSPDMFKVSPITAGDKKRSLQNALVLNNQFNTIIDKQQFIDDYVRDAVDIGTVIAEVGWVTKEEEITEEVPTYEYFPSEDPALAQQYINLLQVKQQSVDEYNNYMNPGLDRAVTMFAESGELYQPVQSGVEEVTRVLETANYPSIEICNIENIIIDPSCNGDISKAQFIGKKFKSSLSELRKDGRYQNLDRILIESADPIGDPDYTDSSDIGSFSFKDDPRRQFVVYTYWGNWDINNSGVTVPIVASWVGNTLIRMEENPFPFKRPPFAKSVYMPVRNSVFGEPDGELLEDNQRIIGATVRGMIDLMGRSANAQTGTKTGFLDVTNKRRYARGEDYEFQSSGDPRMSIYQHQYPEIPQSAYNMITMQNAEAESLTGVKAFSSGINSQALGENVGGAQRAMDAASQREAGILRRIAAGIVDIGKMIIAMNAEFLSEEEVIRVTDEDFITVRRDDLQGKFDLRLGISTAAENNARAQELAFMLQTTGPNSDPAEVRMIRAEIARLRKMPDLAQKIEDYRPEPDPLAVMKAELEIKLLEAQIVKEQMLAAKHQTEAQANGARGFKDGAQGQLNQAKAQTEGAKIRNLHSDSDIKDLNYLEKHTGADQRKEIQKKNVDTANEISKEVVKANLLRGNQKEK